MPDELGIPDESHVSPSPSAYREQNLYNPPPAEYRPPSVLAEHRGLAILFAAVSLGVAIYCLSKPHAGARHQRPAPSVVTPAQPIYVEPLPDTDSH